MATTNRILISTLFLMGMVCFSQCQNSVQPVNAKIVALGKKPAVCCTGKTPPRFGLKAPVTPGKVELDGLAKSAKTK